MRIVEVGARRGTMRGAVTAVAAALATLAAALVWAPTRLPSLVGARPMPAVLAAIALPLWVFAGGLVGRWAVRERGTRRHRLVRVGLGVGLGYAGSISLAVTAMTLVDQGPGALMDPFLLVVRGLVVALSLVPWAGAPAVGAILGLERWTRPAVIRSVGPAEHRPDRSLAS